MTRSETFMQLYRVSDEDLSGVVLPPEGAGREAAREFESDRVRLRRAIRFIAQHPWQIVGSFPSKFWNVWRLDYPGSHSLRQLNAWLTYALWVPWFLVGTWAVVRRGTALQRLVLTVFAYHVLFYLVFASELRYRLPLMALFFLVAAYGLTVAWERVRQLVPSHPVVLRAENRRTIA